jgi:hypothetical protein
MENNTSTPVQIAIKEFGGVRKLARAIGKDAATVSRWQTRGLIPANDQRKLLETAWEQGKSITAHQVIFGRKDD